MSVHIFATSPLAVHPYVIKETGFKLYSAEELSYYIYNNYCIIDDSFACYELADFIEVELHLKASADKVRSLLDSRVNLSLFLVGVLREFHYYSEDDMDAMFRTLEEYRKNSISCRKAIKAHFLMEHGHLVSALKLYLQFDKKTRDASITDEALIKIKHRQAICFLQLGLYEEAMASFLQAYDALPDERILKQIFFLSEMKKMSIPDLVEDQIAPAQQALWKKEYDDVYAKAYIYATTSKTAAIFAKDSIRRSEGLRQTLEALKKQYRQALA